MPDINAFALNYQIHTLIWVHSRTVWHHSGKGSQLQARLCIYPCGEQTIPKPDRRRSYPGGLSLTVTQDKWQHVAIR